MVGVSPSALRTILPAACAPPTIFAFANASNWSAVTPPFSRGSSSTGHVAVITAFDSVYVPFDQFEAFRVVLTFVDFSTFPTAFHVYVPETSSVAIQTNTIPVKLFI